MSTTSREIHLKSRPHGLPTPAAFELATVEVPDPTDGEVLVRNEYMSVDPYMRGRMVDRKSYTPPFQLGEPLSGGAVGRVVKSHHPDFSEGDAVRNGLGWREYFVSDGNGLQKIDTNLAPIQSYLGVMGMPGQTAYFGLLDVGQPKAGETVFVSAAAGAVGAIVCQIAKLKECHVIASAGSPQKLAWLHSIGVDRTLNYKESHNLTHDLGELAPHGIDVYFENVGGEHLSAALTHMNTFGRIAVCGMIAQYNSSEPVPGPTNLGLLIGKRLKMQGFLVSDYHARAAEFYQEMGAWISAGAIRAEETIVDGIASAPDAFIGLFTGENMGKMLVRL